MMVLMMVLVFAMSGLDSQTTRPGGHPATCSAAHHVTQPLTEAPSLPGFGLLPPPSEIHAAVGSRTGADVDVDLTHLAGSKLELERCRRDLPPPHRA